MPIFDFLKKHRLGLLFVLVLSLFAIFYVRIFFPNQSKDARELQENFARLEKQVNIRLNAEAVDYKKFGKLELWEKERPQEVFMHIYRNDSLLYWNTNQLPIIRFADIHFPETGIVHLQNGWYYSKVLELDETKVCASFLIKRDYPYENKDLENTFSPELLENDKSDVVLDKSGFQIKDEKGEYLFSITERSQNELTSTESALLFVLFIAIFIFACVLLFYWWIGLKWKVQLLVLPLVVLLRFGWQYFEFSRFLYKLEAFQPRLYASSEFLPNLGAFLMNLITIVLLIHMLRHVIGRLKPGRFKEIVLQVVFLSLFLFWYFFLFLNKGLIENSTIPFEINRLFELNVYSFLSISAMGVYFHAVTLLNRRAALLMWSSKVKMNRLMLVTFVVGVFYFLYEINQGDQMLFAAVFPFLFLFTIFYITREAKGKFVFTQGLSLFFLFTFCFATNIWVYNEREERSNRELYANQLKTDKDISTELEFEKVKELIREEPVIRRFATSENRITKNDFQDRLERKIFSGFWEQYDMEFHLYDNSGHSNVANETVLKKDMDAMILKHGEPSEVDSFSYFIGDYIDQFSYLYRLPIIDKKGDSLTFYGTFKSKKIPEEIGFPRLLISNQAKVFESLENYSVAKYHKGQLVNHYGEFSFPTYITALSSLPLDSKGYIDYRDYNHFMLKSSGKNHVVLSAPNLGWFDLLTTFSYLFCFLGILVLPFLFNINEFQFGKGTLTLAVKIQLVLVAFVFISLLMYGWGSGIFVRDQYNSYTNKVIDEKLHSVQTEFHSKFGTDSSLDIEKDGGEMSYYLKKFSKVFVTDINFYDTDGYILASSRPKVYNIGLLSEQMNPVALKHMKINFDSEFTHQETIGKLNYSSAYLPFFGTSGDLLGYLNLQHFGQQKEFETQIQRFLTAIINVFMLLLAVSIVIAIFVSGWLTAPLRIIQESFARVNLGQRNEPILYNKEDEIGALVKEYNQKIEELALKAEQLAQSERESAWREMAKQVAHEIKNPLTPMKLGLQHFERMYDPENPMPKEKLQKTFHSLIEQIDGLTRIANEFSNFAKMPNPNASEVELLSLMESVVELFGQDDSQKVVLHRSTKNILLQADKDMLIRIFNNLIKNALQAIQETENGHVEIYITEQDKSIEIEVRDNGKGISEDEKQNIFTPYFTTKSAGTGLGLAMVKQMVELHHGTIHFSSEIEKGTSFFVDLPK